MKTMYRFYRVPDKEAMPILRKKRDDGEICTRDMYPLYAVTYKKKYAKEFRKTRDMEMFIELPMEEVEDEEYALFVNKNRSCELEWHKYKTVIEEKGKYRSCYFPVLSTYAEYNMVVDACENGMIDEDLFSKDDWINVMQYKDKYIKALTFIHYKDCADFAGEYMHPREEDDYEIPKVDWDELGLLLNNFSQFFK